MSWRRLGVLVGALPRESATVRSVSGESAAWGPTEHLLAAALDTLQAANWQRSGGKGQRPKPLKRPGAKPDGVTKIGGKGRSVAEMRVLLDKWRAGGE